MNYESPSNEEIQKYIEVIIKEINVLQLMEGKNQENENSVKLYEYYNYNEEIAIVMELCDKNLSALFINKKNINFSFSEIKEILNQLNNSFIIIMKKLQ